MLNTGLDMESLSICVRLCEQGINPEALSAVIKELRKASETLKVQKLAPIEQLTSTYYKWIKVESRQCEITRPQCGVV